MREDIKLKYKNCKAIISVYLRDNGIIDGECKYNIFLKNESMTSKGFSDKKIFDSKEDCVEYYKKELIKIINNL